MKKIWVKKYKIGDIYRIPGYREPLPDMEDRFRVDMTYTGIAEDGEYVFVAGITPYWEGHAEAWVSFTKQIKDYVAAYGTVRDLLHILIVKHNLHRVTAHCRAYSEDENRFLRHLGFLHEGFLPWYGPGGTDYRIYGRVTGWQ